MANVLRVVRADCAQHNTGPRYARDRIGVLAVAVGLPLSTTSAQFVPASSREAVHKHRAFMQLPLRDVRVP
jgi:hypothetical protein